jgi:hypothetical protein
MVLSAADYKVVCQRPWNRFLKESYRNDFLIQLESFKRNLSELFLQNWNLSEWNISEGIFLEIMLAKPESFRMESYRKNLAETTF